MPDTSTARALAIKFPDLRDWKRFQIVGEDNFIKSVHPHFYPLPIGNDPSIRDVAHIIREVLLLKNEQYFFCLRQNLPEFQWLVDFLDRLIRDIVLTDIQIVQMCTWQYSWDANVGRITIVNAEGYAAKVLSVRSKSYEDFKKTIIEAFTIGYDYSAEVERNFIDGFYGFRAYSRLFRSLFVYISRRMKYYNRNNRTIFTYLTFVDQMVNNENLRTEIGFSYSDVSQIAYRTALDKNDRSPLFQVFSHGQSVPELIPFKLQGKEETDPLLFGVELECKTDLTVEQIIQAFPDLFLAAKADSTITGNKKYAYELVTVPASLLIHRKMWAILFDKFDPSKFFDTTKETGNGFHVHIGQDAFYYTAYGSNNDSQFLTDGTFNSPHLRHVNAFTWLIVNPDNYDFMLEFSGRKQADMNTWSPMPFHGNRQTNESKKKNAQLHSTNYIKPFRGAVHITKKGTVEVRLFKGIVDYARMMSNLEFLDAAFHFTAQASYLGNTLVGFLQWLEVTPENKYMSLKRFIKGMTNLPKLTNEKGKARTFQVSDKTLKLQENWFKNFLKNDNIELHKKGF